MDPLIFWGLAFGQFSPDEVEDLARFLQKEDGSVLTDENNNQLEIA